MTALLIVIILILVIKINDMNTELKNLKKQIEKLKENNEEELSANNDNQELPNIQVINNEEEEKELEEQRVIRKQKIERDIQSKRNTAILGTGAILLVLAAIVFLVSTWTIVSNFIKTAVIFILVGVFSGASKIAKEKGNLQKTSATFYYIAMAYLPISFISVSIFKLLGEYLSIFGEGKYIYFTIVSLILSVIYGFEAKRTKNTYIEIMNRICNYLAISFGIYIFNADIKLVISILSIYSCVLLFSKNKLTKTTAEIGTSCLTVLSLVVICFTMKNFMFFDLITGIFLTANYYILQEKNKLYETLYLLGMYFSVFIFANLKIMSLTFETKYIVMLVSTILIYLYGFLDKRIQASNSILTMVVMFILYIISIINPINSIPSYVIVYIITILTIINYLFRKDYKETVLHLIPIEIIVSALNTVITLKVQLIWLVIVGMVMLLISNNKKIQETTNGIFDLYGNGAIIIGIIVSLINNFDLTINNIIIFALILATYIIKYHNGKISFYKIMTYISINSLIISIFHILNLTDFIKYIVPMTTMGIAFAELYIEKLNDEISNLYVLTSLIISLISLNIDINKLSFIFILLLILVFSIYQRRRNLSEYLSIISLLAVVPGIFTEQILQFGTVNLSLIASLALIAISTVLSIKKGELNIYTFASFAYILLQSITLEIVNETFKIYTNIILVIILGAIHTMFSDKKIFKIIVCLFGLILYNRIVEDLSLTDMTTIYLLGYISALIVLTRVILKNWEKDSCRGIEYVGCFLIFWVAITRYADQLDGMFYVVFLVMLMMFSYINKYGPIFLSSIIAIIVNVFLLTREFWFSVPWWIYLLVVGIVLICFAMKNEAQENKAKNKFIEKIKEYSNM